MFGYKKLRLIIYLLFFFSMAFAVQGQTHDAFLYEIIDERSITITEYIGNDANVVIPVSIDGLPVTTIGYQSFFWNKNLTSIIIPPSVTVIGDEAFYNCENLTSIDIPSSVTVIGQRAFYFCESLTSVTIPFSVTTIRKGAFSHCAKLTNINVDIRNTAYTSIDGVLFNKSGSILLCYPAAKRGAYTVPSTVTAIEDVAFAGSYYLTNITIPSSVTAIGYGAFVDCKYLTSVTIPPLVTTIGEMMFWGCSSLSGVTIPSSVTTIGDDAFYSCSSIATIAIPKSVTFIGRGAFVYCYSLTSINVDTQNNTYASIDGVLFDKNMHILIYYPTGKRGGYSIPTTVTTIGEIAFLGCKQLTDVFIHPSVIFIGYNAFVSCDKLSSVTISRNTRLSNPSFDERVQILYRD